MRTVFTVSLYMALFIHVALMMVVAVRLWCGANLIDRLTAAELLSNLTAAVLVLAALIFRNTIYIEVALGLAALGFVSVVAFAKYTSDKRMF